MSSEAIMKATDPGREFVNNADIKRFAEQRVNLRKEDADDLRQQAGRLAQKLTNYISDHPHFELRRLMLSGSLAKGTALKSISDVDMACYVSSEVAPHSTRELIEWLVVRLRTAFPNFTPDQVYPKEYSIGVRFLTTGNEIDIVPILYSGDSDWRGNLVSKDTGEKLMTSIPLHLEFVRKRKQANNIHYAQLVRLLKFWCNLRKAEDENFRCKSFMIELIIAHLADRGMVLNDYPNALANIFAFIGSDEFKTTIAFSDYYDPQTCEASLQPVRVWDPVNNKNNVAKLYNLENKSKIVDAAMDAGDAVDSALRAVTKSEAVRYWQKVFGPTFNV